MMAVMQYTSIGIFLVCVAVLSNSGNAFAPSIPLNGGRVVNDNKQAAMFLVPAAVPDTVPSSDMTSPVMMTQTLSSLSYRPNVLADGIQSYMNQDISSSATSSTTSLVSVQEIKKVSQEEIEQKKFTFNLIFWGGGFVAPFLATVFYFGFKFWEK